MGCYLKKNSFGFGFPGGSAPDLFCIPGPVLLPVIEPRTFFMKKYGEIKRNRILTCRIRIRFFLYSVHSVSEEADPNPAISARIRNPDYQELHVTAVGTKIFPKNVLYKTHGPLLSLFHRGKKLQG